jgi:hypothetical protein
MVAGAVVDFALTLPEVHPEKLVINGWSLGGYLAPRAASGEHRLAPCIADPGQWSLADSFRALAHKIGIPASAVANLGALDEIDIQKIQSVIDGNRDLRWKMVQRGFLANGKLDLRGYFAEAERYTMNGHAEGIRCPTLLRRPRMIRSARVRRRSSRFAKPEAARHLYRCRGCRRPLHEPVASQSRWLEEVLT